MKPLWEPTPAQTASTRLAHYLRCLEAERGLAFAGYHELWAWSTSDLEARRGASA